MRVRFTNTGDRPIQVGSHYPLGKMNPAMTWDRGFPPNYKLDIPAGTATRFEPGESKEVTIVRTGGKSAPNPDPPSELALRGVMVPHKESQFPSPDEDIEPYKISRETYASMYGPTVGDRIRLADSDLWAEIEVDHTVYGLSLIHI